MKLAWQARITYVICYKRMDVYVRLFHYVSNEASRPLLGGKRCQTLVHTLISSTYSKELFFNFIVSNCGRKHTTENLYQLPYAVNSLKRSSLRL
jgi:hypothetical protein